MSDSSCILISKLCINNFVSDSDTTCTEVDSSLQQSPISSSSIAEVEASPLHKFAFDGNFDSLRKLILERDADVNLPLKDGSTPLLKAAENGHDGTYIDFSQKKTHNNHFRLHTLQVCICIKVKI